MDYECTSEGSVEIDSLLSNQASGSIWADHDCRGQGYQDDFELVFRPDLMG